MTTKKEHMYESLIAFLDDMRKVRTGPINIDYNELVKSNVELNVVEDAIERARTTTIDDTTEISVRKRDEDEGDGYVYEVRTGSNLHADAKEKEFKNTLQLVLNKVMKDVRGVTTHRVSISFRTKEGLEKGVNYFKARMSHIIKTHLIENGMKLYGELEVDFEFVVDSHIFKYKTEEEKDIYGADITVKLYGKSEFIDHVNKGKLLESFMNRTSNMTVESSGVGVRPTIAKIMRDRSEEKIEIMLNEIGIHLKNTHSDADEVLFASLVAAEFVRLLSTMHSNGESDVTNELKLTDEGDLYLEMRTSGTKDTESSLTFIYNFVHDWIKFDGLDEIRSSYPDGYEEFFKKGLVPKEDDHRRKMVIEAGKVVGQSIYFLMDGTIRESSPTKKEVIKSFHTHLTKLAAGIGHNDLTHSHIRGNEVIKDIFNRSEEDSQ